MPHIDAHLADVASVSQFASNTSPQARKVAEELLVKQFGASGRRLKFVRQSIQRHQTTYLGPRLRIGWFTAAVQIWADGYNDINSALGYGKLAWFMEILERHGLGYTEAYETKLALLATGVGKNMNDSAESTPDEREETESALRDLVLSDTQIAKLLEQNVSGSVYRKHFETVVHHITKPFGINCQRPTNRDYPIMSVSALFVCNLLLTRHMALRIEVGAEVNDQIMKELHPQILKAAELGKRYIDPDIILEELGVKRSGLLDNVEFPFTTHTG